MAVYYGYTNVIRGTQSTVNGNPVDYAYTPNGTWRYSGEDTYFVIEENDGATVFNGDGDTNEYVDSNERFGGAWEQRVEVDGVDRQVIWDYTFTVTDGTNTWRVGVIDVDLNNDNDVMDAGENGYFLVFPDGMPPADTNLTTGAVTENDDSTPHIGLGGSVVCFASGTMIETPDGPRAVEDLSTDDLVITGTDGAQPIRWIGATTVVSTGDLAPVVITAGTLGNDADLVVSPQHAILLTDWRAELLYGQEEVLVRAVDLMNMDGVYRSTGGLVTYHHILLDAHHVVQSHGIWSETLYPGDMTKQAVNPAAKVEIECLFPDLVTYGPKAAPCLRAYEAKLLSAA